MTISMERVRHLLLTRNDKEEPRPPSPKSVSEALPVTRSGKSKPNKSSTSSRKQKHHRSQQDIKLASERLFPPRQLHQHHQYSGAGAGAAGRSSAHDSVRNRHVGKAELMKRQDELDEKPASAKWMDSLDYAATKVGSRKKPASSAVVPKGTAAPDSPAAAPKRKSAPATLQKREPGLAERKNSLEGAKKSQTPVVQRRSISPKNTVAPRKASPTRIPELDKRVVTRPLEKPVRKGSLDGPQKPPMLDKRQDSLDGPQKPPVLAKRQDSLEGLQKPPMHAQQKQGKPTVPAAVSQQRVGPENFKRPVQRRDSMDYVRRAPVARKKSPPRTPSPDLFCSDTGKSMDAEERRAPVARKKSPPRTPSPNLFCSDTGERLPEQATVHVAAQTKRVRFEVKPDGQIKTELTVKSLCSFQLNDEECEDLWWSKEERKGMKKRAQLAGQRFLAMTPLYRPAAEQLLKKCIAESGEQLEWEASSQDSEEKDSFTYDEAVRVMVDNEVRGLEQPLVSALNLDSCRFYDKCGKSSITSVLQAQAMWKELPCFSNEQQASMVAMQQRQFSGFAAHFARILAEGDAKYASGAYDGADKLGTSLCNSSLEYMEDMIDVGSEQLMI